MSVEFRRAALADLAYIHDYIAERNPQAALRMAREIVDACEKLELFPERGRAGRQPGTRELTTVWPYIIVYRYDAGLVSILRVWHGRQSR